ncbi:MAG: hypothetical protein LUH45_00365 [Clostridiales bacterium]|nr:hypothetical protein [Clostridiales bacterium]
MSENNQMSYQADQLLVSLRQAYSKYETDYLALKQESGLFGALRSYFSGDSVANDPMHQKFIELVGQLTQKLADVLAELEAPDHWADQAADILLVLRTGKSGDAAEWTRMAAELMLEPLLSYLSRPRLEQALKDYRATYRRMLPTQEKLAKNMAAELERR